MTVRLLHAPRSLDLAARHRSVRPTERLTRARRRHPADVRSCRYLRSSACGAVIASAAVMRVICFALLLQASVVEAQTQDLGHRLPSGAGLDAGTQVDQGLYLGDRLVWFAANEVRDRDGDRVPIENLDLDAYANVFGIAGTKKLGVLYLSAAVAVPLVKLSLQADAPQASVDRLGLGAVFVEPIKLGARFTCFDLVGSYSVYAPTSQGERTGVGRPQWSHQLAAGGTLYFDDRRGWRLSALASYVHNRKKRGIDITRGDSILIQGGVGGPLRDGIDLGLAGYALWQVTDDRGADLPIELSGARERAFGLGPELGVAVPALRSRLTARFTWDLDGKARPVGTILVLGLSVVAWR